MDFAFKTLAEFNDYFQDEKTCYEFLEGLRWDNGQAVCPHCGTAKKPYKVTARGKFKEIPSYRCSERECGLPFTVRTGSIYEGSKVELRKWFQASYELSISKKGISSVELAQRIGVSQKTAWFINHRLRCMLIETSPELIDGEIELDETYVGGKEKNRHASKRTEGTQGRSTKTKKPVFGILKRNGDVYVKVVPKTDAQTLLPLMVARIAPGANVYTDELSSYRPLSKHNYNHGVVSHGKGEYVNGSVHVNGIEGFWSQLKRGIVGTFHQVSHRHLQKYCDEFAFRHNTKSAPVSAVFIQTLKNSGNARLTYRVLTESNGAE